MIQKEANKTFSKKFFSFCRHYNPAFKTLIPYLFLCWAVIILDHYITGLALMPIVVFISFAQQNISSLFDRTLELLELIMQQQKEINVLTAIVKHMEQKEKEEENVK